MELSPDRTVFGICQSDFLSISSSKGLVLLYKYLNKHINTYIYIYTYILIYNLRLAPGAFGSTPPSAFEGPPPLCAMSEARLGHTLLRFLSLRPLARVAFPGASPRAPAGGSRARALRSNAV